MTVVHETAYPRLRSALTDAELQELYTPTPADLAFIARATKSTVAAFGGLLLLKTFQRLGYFLSFDDVPPRLLRHLATATGVLLPHDCLQQYEQRGERGEPSRQEAVWIFPLRPGGVVRGKGRLGEDIQPSKAAEGLIEIDSAPRAAARLVQPLSGAQTEPGTGGGDPTRAGRAGLCHAWIEPEVGQQRKKEDKASDAGPSAASWRQRHLTPIRPESLGWASGCLATGWHGRCRPDCGGRQRGAPGLGAIGRASH